MTDPEKNTEQARREETVTAEAFASFNFEKCIESVAAFEFTSLSSHFSKASKEALEAEDGTAAAALILLNVICSIHFTPEDQSRPWGPMMEWDGKRTAIPSDFRGEQNDVLSTLAPSIRV
ncbi:MAG: hypothetical protein Q7S99_14955 [Parvibaculum sp.]|nr:hypothetical protein [Parvibaculum sp.]